MENMSLSCENKDKEEKVTVEEEDNEILKRRISDHPLYRLLLQSHLDCLKVGGDNGQFKIKNTERRHHLKQQGNNCLELDQFMEAYCIALGKLKEEFEEPQQKSMAFISRMHSQLIQLTTTSTHHFSTGESQEGTKSERP
ncbi:homeobox protein knotted-1-like 1 [Humulus lupulus]|uniref:homeobox protein knotted-1-like 1 n=1 Tax=Humulus lupulus TaxID=3486 RepID=UPI002B416041|nr:homeobox protein knotted-1-like 1 [Humulus lupulus]